MSVRRLFLGSMGLSLMCFVMSMELAGKGTKTAAGNWLQVPFGLGGVFASTLAMGVRDWRTYQVQVSLYILKLCTFKLIICIARS